MEACARQHSTFNIHHYSVSSSERVRGSARTQQVGTSSLWGQASACPGFHSPDRFLPPPAQLAADSLARLEDAIGLPLRVDLRLVAPEAGGQSGEVGGAEGGRFGDA